MNGGNYTKEKTVLTGTLWNEEVKVSEHFEKGEKVGESRERTDFSGNKVIDHFDVGGNKIAESRYQADWTGATRLVHTGTDYTPQGSTRNEKDIVGNPIRVDYDQDGIRRGTSREQQRLIEGTVRVYEGTNFPVSRLSKNRENYKDQSGEISYGINGLSQGDISGVVWFCIFVLFAGLFVFAAFREPLQRRYRNFLITLEAKDKQMIYSVEVYTGIEKEFGRGQCPIFSPDGKEMILTRKTRLGERVYSADVAGNNLEYIAKEHYSCWNPNGSAHLLVKGGHLTQLRAVPQRGLKKYPMSYSLGTRGDISELSCSKEEILAYVVSEKEGKALYVRYLGNRPRANKPFRYWEAKDLQLIGWSPDGKNLVVYKDGQTYLLKFSLGIWYKGTMSFTFPVKAIDKIEYIPLLPKALLPLRWSSDGTKIVFQFGGRLRLVRNDFSHPVWLCPGENPQWSPNGQKIAFKHQGNLYYTSDKKIEPRILAKNVEDFNWAPNSKQIFFTRKMEKHKGWLRS